MNHSEFLKQFIKLLVVRCSFNRGQRTTKTGDDSYH